MRNSEREIFEVTDFERRLSEIVESIMSAGGTGYLWAPADEVVATVGIPDTQRKYRTRFKRAAGGSRAANVLKESPQMTATVYFIVVKSPYTINQLLEVVIPDMRRNPHQTAAVAIITEESSTWRVRKIVAHRDDEVFQALVKVFPEGADNALLLSRSAAMASPRTPPGDSVLCKCLDEFEEFVISNGYLLPLATTADLLASALSSQFILLAGPSGTGKSVSARLLASFFCPPSRIATIDSRRQWLSPEDVVGYFSPITGSFIRTALTSEIGRLAISPDDDWEESRAGAPSPFLIVEEANLSPLEGYLGPLVHGLSSTSSPIVEWKIAAPGQKMDLENQGESALNLGPYLRFFGTINVDASAPAPAKKISARACVVVMEPAVLPDSQALLGSLAQQGQETGSATWASLMQDPHAILAVSDVNRQEQAYDALKSVFKALPSSVGLSYRDLHRCLLYVLWFRGLVSAKLTSDSDNVDALRVGAENAILHFVLPGLTPHSFRESVESILNLNSSTTSCDQQFGGVLRSRLARLQELLDESEGFFGALDFWNALS